MAFSRILLLLLIISAACSERPNDLGTEVEQKETSENPETISEEQTIEDASPAKEWLERAVIEYFSQELNDRSTITTPSYNEYKGDMMNSVYTHGIPLDSLKKKWSHKYEVSKENTGTGFLINAQDYYKIKIQSCLILPSEKQGEYKLKLTLCDVGYDKCHESDVTVIEYNGGYAIDNVKEHYH